jgi:hypothetical protein
LASKQKPEAEQAGFLLSGRIAGMKKEVEVFSAVAPLAECNRKGREGSTSLEIYL